MTATAACSRADFHDAMSMTCAECGDQPGPTTAVTTVIYKYPFGESVEIDVPEGEVRHVAAQRPNHPTPTVWVEHPLHPAGAKMRLRLFGTGHAINGPSGWVFVGSAVCANGDLVWHVFRSPGTAKP